MIEYKECSLMAEMQSRRRNHAASNFSDKYIYVFGGKNAKETLDTIERYEVDKQAWFFIPVKLKVSRVYIGFQSLTLNFAFTETIGSTKSIPSVK